MKEIAGTPSRCLRPGCENPVKCRGLCVPCYNVARFCVSVGKTTWKRLEADGKTVPPKRKMKLNRDTAEDFFLGR